MTRLKPLLPLIAAVALASSASVVMAADSAKASKYYEDAVARFERRDIDGAILQLKNALQQDKSLLPVHVLLGKALLSRGDAGSAEVEFQEAIRLGVDRAEVALPLAQALTIQGKQQQVFEDPRLAPNGLPPTVQFLMLLHRASAYSDVGDVRNALKSIEAARALAPTNPDSWLTEVPVRIRSRQLQEALAAAEQALKLAPNSAEAFYQKGSVQHVQGQIRQALESYDRSIQLSEEHFEARMARAGIRFDLNRDADASEDLRALQGIAPNEPRATYLRALLAERSGDAAATKKLLLQVTELLDPVPIEVIRYRPQTLLLNGLAHFGLNQLDRAKPYLEYALRLQPNSPITKLVAQIAIREGNQGRAIELLETYLRGQPGDGQALLMLASAHMSQGRYGKATTIMQEALRAKDSPEFRTTLGISLLNNGQSGNALVELERAFRTDPKQTYAGMALVGLYLNNGQVEKARKSVDAMLKVAPKNATLHVLKGQTLSRAGDHAAARAAYEQALVIDKALVEAHIGVARADIALRRFEAARKRLADQLKASERNSTILYEMAVLSEAQNKDQDALDWLLKAVEASGPRDTRANLSLVAWYLRKFDAPKALGAARQLLAKTPDDVEALSIYATCQMLSNDLAGARSTLTNASRRAGSDTPSLVLIARAQMRAQDLGGAAYSLDKALSAQPNDPDAQSTMALVDLLRGDFPGAERRADQLIRNFPKRADGWNLMSDIAIKRGQLTTAVDALRRAHAVEGSVGSLLTLFRTMDQAGKLLDALALADSWTQKHPGDSQVQKAAADVLARAGKFVEARKRYEQVVARAPNDVEALNNLANVLIRLQAPEALPVAEKALKLAPTSPVVIDTAGWANHIAGKRERSLQLLRDARLRAPQMPDIRVHLAKALIALGKTAEARRELEEALQLKTQFEGQDEAKTLLQTLK